MEYKRCGKKVRDSMREKRVKCSKELRPLPYILNTFFFLMIGIVLFQILQFIFMAKHFPYDKAADAGKFRYYVEEEKNSIDVLICGTSHVSRGILPMEIYESDGIKSYNLATSAQPIEATYYILKEAIKSQRPKVVVWDVSNLYLTYKDPFFWKIAMDELPFNKNKIQLIKEYQNNISIAEESLLELTFPLIEYHSRWKYLFEEDFRLLKSNKHYFAKGGQISSIVLGGISIEEMNSITDGLLRNTIRDVYEYSGIEFNELHEENILYDSNATNLNIEWLIKIKELCETNGIELLAIKVPSVDIPQYYNSTWTLERYNKTHALCEEYGIAYYDLLYDVDATYDYGKDSSDKGRHLNLNGAQKASRYVSNYLREYYGLSGEYDEQWDRDLMSYQKVRKVVLLELEQDFSAYINLLFTEHKDGLIFIAALDDMALGLNDADKKLLETLGLRTDFSRAPKNSYIAVIENGKVKYEALSNRGIDYTGVCSKSKRNYSLHSDGWWTGSQASITIDEKEYAACSRGLNIVVYDDERDLILDSVSFDTSAEYHTPFRNNEMISQMEEKFERYIVEVEDK